MFGPDDSRYVSEWDYYAAERERDIAEFYAMDNDFMDFQEIREGKSYRETMVISGRTADIALIPYKDVSSNTSYVFVLGWRDLIFQGDLRPKDLGDEYFPCLEFSLLEQGKEGKVLIAEEIETIDDLRMYTDLDISTQTASEIIFSFFSKMVYDLERGSQVWGFNPRSNIEVLMDEADRYC